MTPVKKIYHENLLSSEIPLFPRGIYVNSQVFPRQRIGQPSTCHKQKEKLYACVLGEANKKVKMVYFISEEYTGKP